MQRWTSCRRQLIPVQTVNTSEIWEFTSTKVVDTKLALGIRQWIVASPAPVLITRHSLERAHRLHSCRIQVWIQQLIRRITERQLYRRSLYSSRLSKEPFNRYSVDARLLVGVHVVRRLGVWIAVCDSVVRACTCASAAAQ